MPKMCEESKEKKYRHYFYGGKKETLETLEKVLKQKYPWLCIAGMYSPPFRELTAEEDEDIVNRINDARPDFIWVALGAPKQEKWMAAHKGKLNGIMLGVGAAFEFEADPKEENAQTGQNGGKGRKNSSSRRSQNKRK